MNISKRSLHYRWVEWVYSFYSREPIPNNLCGYFWKLVLSPLPLIFSFLIYSLSLVVCLALGTIFWVCGFKPNFNFVNLSEPNYCDGPLNTFWSNDYKRGLYSSKRQYTNNNIAPWEVLLVVGAIVFACATPQLSLMFFAGGTLLWLVALLFMRSGKLVGPFIQSVKEKHCKKLTFID